MKKKVFTCIIAMILCLTALAGCGKSSSKSENNGPSKKDKIEHAEILLDTPVVLAGTECCFRVKADEWTLSYGDAIKITSSDEAVASVDKDAKNEALIIKGVSAGKATISIELNGATADAEIRVVEAGSTSTAVLESSEKEIKLKSMANVDFMVNLTNVPAGIEHVNANVYHSREIFVSTKGSWDKAALNLTFYSLGAAGKKGTIVILITDADNPDTVVTSLSLPASVE